MFALIFSYILLSRGFNMPSCSPDIPWVETVSLYNWAGLEVLSMDLALHKTEGAHRINSLPFVLFACGLGLYKL